MSNEDEMNILVNNLLTRNRILEDRNKQVIETSEEILHELENRNNKLVKIRKICLDDKPRIIDHCAQIKLVLME